MKIAIVNGPNLNLLGKRQPEIYGHQSFEAFFDALVKEYEGNELTYFQSNSEGALVDHLHSKGFGEADGIILNAGAYTHTSVALADAVAGIETPVLEVHISNIYAREAFRHHSYLAPVCAGTIAGLGLKGYRLALEYFIDKK
ncbi:type II 3-dehydroquinate dehydratase [Roseivirga sp. BDSF3-8]|uniref:type II 3-dehydroquinate dehydratase n=1 Tax=Roseivirga sp. BDSF3-8 TaxID=3241598 RepID=UPI0035324A91